MRHRVKGDSVLPVSSIEYPNIWNFGLRQKSCDDAAFFPLQPQGLVAL